MKRQCDIELLAMKNEIFMLEAIKEAMLASKKDEVPIGAVAILDDKIIGRAHNERERKKNPLGHAEILLIQKIVRKKILPSWRFEGVTIVVTCEPCVMCMGAMLQARVKKIVFGCFDPKAGACGSLYDLPSDTRLNHRIDVVSGVMKDECGKILSDFFRKKRKC